MVGDLVVAVVADAAPERDVLCWADAGGDGVPDRGIQRESSPGGAYGTLLSGHGLASARFPVRVPLTGCLCGVGNGHRSLGPPATMSFRLPIGLCWHEHTRQRG